MFIRKTIKKDQKTKREYLSYQLVESFRTEKGPRQRILLTVGHDIDLSQEERKLLANRIEEIISGINPLIPYPEKIERLAHIFARKLTRKQSILLEESSITPEQPIRDYQEVDLNTLKHEHSRTIGIEHIVYETAKELQLDQKLKELGLTKRQIQIAIGIIVGKLVKPGSERASCKWLKHNSAIDELLETDFTRISLNSIYAISDILLSKKKKIEQHLALVEQDLFSFKDTVVFYDLTNTYFEGSGKTTKKARGRSKEKRSDRPLITLGLVLNQQGFPKCSKVFEGNIAETKTLKKMIRTLGNKKTNKPTVVLDAGIASEDNLIWLKKEKYPFIVCSRRKKEKLPKDLTYETVRETKANTVKAARYINPVTQEIELYCYSTSKEKKEKEMQTFFQKRFEESLKKLSDGLEKKNGIKDYDKILEKIGRLKEKNKKVTQYYKIKIEKKQKRVKSITWELKKDKRKSQGIYCLRTHGLTFNTKELWDTYVMLTDVEEAFKCLKSELGLRPVYHQTDKRIDGHLFICLLAYHLMQTILHKLALTGLRMRWETLRSNMNTQVRVTTSMQSKNKKQIHIRTTTNPELFHEKIYSALGIDSKPGKSLKTFI